MIALFDVLVEPRPPVLAKIVSLPEVEFFWVGRKVVIHTTSQLNLVRYARVSLSWRLSP